MSQIKRLQELNKKVKIRKQETKNVLQTYPIFKDPTPEKKEQKKKNMIDMFKKNLLAQVDEKKEEITL